jgi:transposase-like protein
MFTVPKPYPKEFRDDVVNAACKREPGQHLRQIAADFGISESFLTNCVKAADVEDGAKPGTSAAENGGPAGGQPADPATRAGERGVAPRGCLSVAGESAGRMMYPLVRELAVDGRGRQRPRGGSVTPGGTRPLISRLE